jgi:hypothetical protein
MAMQAQPTAAQGMQNPQQVIDDRLILIGDVGEKPSPRGVRNGVPDRVW